MASASSEMRFISLTAKSRARCEALVCSSDRFAVRRLLQFPVDLIFEFAEVDLVRRPTDVHRLAVEVRVIDQLVDDQARRLLVNDQFFQRLPLRVVEANETQDVVLLVLEDLHVDDALDILLRVVDLLDQFLPDHLEPCVDKHFRFVFGHGG